MKHSSHGTIALRLKRAEGHLRSIITMIEEGRPCLDIAQQMHAVEKAITNAKREMIHDHIDHSLEDAGGGSGRQARETLAEFKAISKYL